MFVGLTAGILLSGNSSHAQTDSIALMPVNIRGFVPEKFMSGLKIQQIDSATLYTYKFQNIADLLSVFTPIAFNKYGPGQLTTAFFRGTSANHTAVLWNGLNINSPTLGQTDFSTIPVAGFDALSVQFGSAASIVGTDAVGGSILLSSEHQNKTTEVSIAGQLESFDNYQMQFVGRYHSTLNKQWSMSAKTSGYWNRLNNHFPHSQRRDYALLPAEASQRGLIQDIFLTSKKDQEISAHVWLTSNRLTTSPDNLAGRELTLTEAYRTMLRYRARDLTLRTAWVRDVIDYAKGDFDNPDHAVTDKFSSRAEHDFSWNMQTPGSGIYVKAGAEWTHYRTSVPGYEKRLITENRADLFLLTRWQVNQRLVASLNLRQALITGFNPPFTPSLGGEYQLVQEHHYQLKLKSALSRSYRVPTMNERYWAVLGNPNIRPESGWNKEIGLEQTVRTSYDDVFTTSVTGYHNRIKDWTYWNPVKNYRIENLQQVLARGIELQLGWRRSFDILKSGLNFNYAFNKSVQEKAYDAYSVDVIGKQLRFVPIHSAGLHFFFQYKIARLTAQMQSVGKRYTTFDNATFLKEYALVNLIGEVTIPFAGVYLRIQGQVNNVSNTFYLNTQNYAMPGRSFAINLVAAFRQSPKAAPVKEN